MSGKTKPQESEDRGDPCGRTNERQEREVATKKGFCAKRLMGWLGLRRDGSAAMLRAQVHAPCSRGESSPSPGCEGCG